LAKSKQGSSRRGHTQVTASDVARLAGVSPMTVSRVINGEASVKESTRVAVNKAIRKLGYSPNKAARSLASASDVQIGLLYANPSSAYLSAMLLGVLEQARQSDTQIMLVECAPGSDPTQVIRGLIRSGVDGVMVTPPAADDPAVLRLLRKQSISAVTIGTVHEQDDIASVRIDDYAAALAMTRHIIALGHRRIGYIKGGPEHWSTCWRMAGYRDALREAGLDIEDELVVDGDYSYRSGLRAADRLLSLRPAPTAIFASNDDMAAATVATAHRYSIGVPKGLTVCGFDDTFLATTIWPELTTIRQPIADMSQAAIDLLVKSVRARRAGLEPECQHVELPFQLVQRQSDAPPAKAIRRSA
jgi:LacI family transcriptional regulator